MKMKQSIEVGDGSMQKRLAAGLCPKCRNTLTINQDKKTIDCHVCGLQILDSEIFFDNIEEDSEQSQEIDMHETYLMPSEEDFCAAPEKMEWATAVRYVEEALEIFIKEKSYDPSLPEEVVLEDLPNLRIAWQRILAG